MQFLSEKAVSGRFGTDSLKNLFLWTKSAQKRKFCPKTVFGQFSAALVREFGDFVREFALLCGKLCENLPFCARNFPKNLAMANFCVFGLTSDFFVFSGDFLSF